MHDVQGGALLGDEEHRLAVVDGGRHDVGDGLRLACPGRPLHHQIAAGPRRRDDLGLGRVGVHDVEELARVRETPVEILGRREHAGLDPEAAGQQLLNQRVDLAFGFGGFQVLPHQELGERIEAQLDEIRPHLPARPMGNGRRDAGEILRREPVRAVGKVRQRQVEVRLQPRTKRQVRLEVLIAERQPEAVAGPVALQVHRQQDEGREAFDLRALALVPTQKAEAEEEHAHALFLFDCLRFAVEREQALLQRLRGKPRLQLRVDMTGGRAGGLVLLGDEQSFA